MINVQWQVKLINVLKHHSSIIDLLPYVDDLLLLLAKFDLEKDDFCQQCVALCADEFDAKYQIIKIIDQLMLRDERDIVRIFGRKSFTDPTRKTLKRKYQRLCRVFHPDLKLAEESWLTLRMSVINIAYELAQENFEAPFSVEKSGVATFNTSYSNVRNNEFEKAPNDVRSGERRRKKRRNEKVRPEPNGIRHSAIESDWLAQLFATRWARFKVSFIQLVYSLDSLARRRKFASKFKFVIFVLVSFICFAALLQLIPRSVDYDIKEEDVTVQSQVEGMSLINQELQALPISDEDIDIMLDQLLEENSTSIETSNGGRGVVLSDGQYVDLEPQKELDFKWEAGVIKPSDKDFIESGEKR